MKVNFYLRNTFHQKRMYLDIFIDYYYYPIIIITNKRNVNKQNFIKNIIEWDKKIFHACPIFGMSLMAVELFDTKIHN